MRVGLIGAGVIAHRLGRAFKASEKIQITAICDVDWSSATDLARCIAAAADLHTDYRKLCESENVDLIYIGVPPSHHCEMTLAALVHSKHVICEKPLALSDEETQAMVDKERETASRVTAVNMPLRYTPAIHKLKAMINSQQLGTLSGGNILLRFPQWPRAWQQSNWLKESREGGALREVGTHFLFALLEVVPSPVKRVFAVVQRANSQRAEHRASGLLQCENGFICSLDLVTDVAVNEENSLTIFGSEATVTYYEWSRLKVLRKDSINEEEGGKWNELRLPDVDCSKALVEDVLKAIDEKQRGLATSHTLVNFETGHQVNKILNAVYNSNGRWIDL